MCATPHKGRISKCTYLGMKNSESFGIRIGNAENGAERTSRRKENNKGIIKGDKKIKKIKKMPEILSQLLLPAVRPMFVLLPAHNESNIPNYG